MQYPEEGSEATTPIWVPPPKMSGLARCSCQPGSCSRLAFPHLGLPQVLPFCPRRSLFTFPSDEQKHIKFPLRARRLDKQRGTGPSVVIGDVLAQQGDQEVGLCREGEI